MASEWFEHVFGIQASPRWRCPFCYEARLVREGGIVSTSDFVSREVPNHDEEWSGYCQLQYRCAACRRRVLAQGHTWDVDHQGTQAPETVFRPCLILPSVLMITLPSGVPQNVQESIREASAMVWLDQASAVNRLRVALERLMSHWKIAGSHRQAGGKRRFVPLAIRLAKFKAKHPDRVNHDFPQALRVLGNEASHGQGVTWEQAGLAFRLMESVLNAMYDTSEATLAKKARRLAGR